MTVEEPDGVVVHRQRRSSPEEAKLVERGVEMIKKRVGIEGSSGVKDGLASERALELVPSSIRTVVNGINLG